VVPAFENEATNAEAMEVLRSLERHIWRQSVLPQEMKAQSDASGLHSTPKGAR
jgi:hypothetical protein